MARFVQIAMGSGAELSYGFLLARDLSLMQAAEYDVVKCGRQPSRESSGMPAETRHFVLGAKG